MLHTEKAQELWDQTDVCVSVACDTSDTSDVSACCITHILFPK